MQEIYSTPEKIPNYTAHGTMLPVVHTGTQDHIGTALFLVDVWTTYGIRGLYELLLGEVSVGAFALLPNACFCTYEILAEEAHLPPEPQHAMFAVLRTDKSTHDREMACLVYHPATEGMPEGFRFFQKRACWQVGRYESRPVATIMEALRLYQTAKSNTLLLPYRIQHPILAQ